MGVEVKRDSAKPTADVDWNAASRTVTPTGTDGGSGVAVVEYQLGEGPWTAAAGATAVGDAATTVRVRVTDVAGNISDVAEVAVPVKTTDPGTDPGTTPGGGGGTDPGSEPTGSLTGNEAVRIGVTQVAPGGQLPISVSGAAPGTVFAVEFRSTPARLGTLTVGADGTASGVFTVPAYAEAGVHTVALMVPGGELTAQVTVVVPGASSPQTPPLAVTGQDDRAVRVGLWVGSTVLVLGLLAMGVSLYRRRRSL